MVPLQLAALHAGLANMLIGAVAAIVTDVFANPLSVIKTYRQSNTKAMSYRQIVAHLVSEHGYLRLFTTGLATRIGVDILSGALFTAVWRWLAQS